MDPVLGLRYPVTIPDNQFTVTGSADATKLMKFEVDTETTGFTFTWDIGAQNASRTLTVPVLIGNDTIATLATTQTLSGDKTFSSGTVTVSSAASTAQVVVAAIAGQVAQFNIRGNAVATGLVVQHDGSSDATIANFANRSLFIGTNASNNIQITASPGNVLVLTATDATASGTGAFRVAGGVAITKNLLALQGSGRGLTSTVTAAGTTTLTNASTVIQIFTGTTTQTCQFPAASLFGAGIGVEVIIINRSTGAVLAQRAGSDTFDGGGSGDSVLTNTTRHYFSNGVDKWHTIA